MISSGHLYQLLTPSFLFYIDNTNLYILQLARMMGVLSAMQPPHLVTERRQLTIVRKGKTKERIFDPSLQHLFLVRRRKRKQQKVNKRHLHLVHHHLHNHLEMTINNNTKKPERLLRMEYGYPKSCYNKHA